jgi:ABC-type lipoprotein export system ATPase subunit
LKGGNILEVIRAEQVCYTYSTKYQKIEAVKKIDFSFETENLYAITGESGSGKSTFLSLLAGLALPTSGTIYVEGKDMRTIDRDEYRKDQASVVYQSFHLFPLLTALENVMFPIELKGVKKEKASAEAKLLLKKVGLPDKIWSQFPQMMSGGEQQRVAIARAMAAGGKILLADEPTGNLDSKNEKNIVELLKNLAHTEKYVVIVITHNPVVAAEADVILRLKDGELQRGEEHD